MAAALSERSILFTFCFKLPAQMITKYGDIALQFILNNKGIAMQCPHSEQAEVKKCKQTKKTVTHLYIISLVRKL